jgi:hemolysin activation/secretion protein
LKLRIWIFTALFASAVSLLRCEPVLIPEIRGLILVGSPDEAVEVPPSIEGISACGLCIPGGLKKLTHCLRPVFQGQPMTVDKLQELKCAISSYWRSQGHPFVYCFVPSQDITDGVVQFIVVETQVGEITHCPTRWFPKWQTVGKLHIRPGCPLNTHQICRDLSWINENPFHYSTIFLKPGPEPFTTDVNVHTCDRFPLRPWIGADNTGTIFTGRTRYFIGATWGNAFCRGHLASYQYMTDSKMERFQAHFGSYTVPLPWRHYLRAYGGWSRVKPNLVDGRMKGHSCQASLHYDWRFCSSTECCRSGLIAGFNYKSTNNNLEYIDSASTLVVPIITGTINISQFALGYYLYKGFRNSLGVTDCCNRFELRIDGFWQPGQLFENESAFRYDELSPGAKPRYAYVRAEADLKVRAPFNSAIVARLAGQGATTHLLPSEQFGLGGMYTIRGYSERELNADNALLVSFELHTPPLCPLIKKKAIQELTFLAFVDYGFGNNNAKAPGEKTINSLLGVGPGVRYRLWTYLYAQADWGIRLVKNQFNQPTGGWSWFYFSVNASY